MSDAAVTRPPPAPVAAVAAGGPVREAWENELGGRTFEVGAGARPAASVPRVILGQRPPAR